MKKTRIGGFSSRLVMVASMALILAVGVGGVLTGSVQADNNAPMRSKRIKVIPTHESSFMTRNQFGQCRGTFVSGTQNRIKIKVKRGYEDAIIEVPLFNFGAGPAFQMVSKMAKIPEDVTEYYDIKPGRGLLVHVDASELPLGELAEWKNQGELNGAFLPMNVPPKVEDFKGRRGVRFDPDNGKLAKPGHTTLAANFMVNDYLGYGAPFTFTAWVYCETLESKTSIETHSSMLTWGALCGNQQTWLNLAKSDIAGMSCTPGEGPGASTEWQLLTYTYTGGEDGEFSIYRNGELLSRQKYDVKIDRLPVTDITATTATLNGELFTRDGKAACGVLFWGEEDFFQWYIFRHVYWDFTLDMGRVDPGKFHKNIDGLLPSTKYYFRYATQDADAFKAAYSAMETHRFAYGPGMFVTASEDGKTPGRIIPNDPRNFFFIGGNRGSRWFMRNPGPSLLFDGLISEIKLYDYAMDTFEVRASLGLSNAFQPTPAQGAKIEERKLALTWKPGRKGVASYRVYYGIDKKAVEDGSATRTDTKEPTLDIKKMRTGVTQFWRVEQLNQAGAVMNKGILWSFESDSDRPTAPRPADGGTMNANGKLVWDYASSGGPFTTRIYLAESKKELNRMVADVKPYRQGPRDNTWGTFPTMDRARPGRTYYWKVDIVVFDKEEDGQREKRINRVIPGPIWTFHVENYYTPEVDTVWGKPPYDHDSRATTGIKQCEERVGYRTRSVSLAPSKVLRDDITFGISRVLYKQRKLQDIVLAHNCGTKTTHWRDLGNPGLGINSMAYGGIGGDVDRNEGGLSDSHLFGENMTMHEYGHHMHGLAGVIPGFASAGQKVFENHKDDNIDVGGYGGANPGEDMAIGFHHMNRATDRYRIYYENRPKYHVLREITAGDRYIDLTPRVHQNVNANGDLASWGNSGGLILYDESPGIYTYQVVPGTQGTFTPIGSPIQSVQSGGVQAFKLDGGSALLWGERTKLALHDNRDFSAQFWVRKQPGSSKDAVLAALTGKDGESFQFRWSDFPGAKEGVWQSLSFTYEGGGDTGNKAGKLRIFVGEKEVSTTNRTFDLPHEASLSIGGWVKDPANPSVTDGFTGELGQIRIYSYDISEDQVEEYFAEENPHYTRTPDAIAEKLYVDVDCRRYKDLPQHRHEPFHPDNLRKPWLRSWPNFGSLGGRMHNDIDTRWEYAGSTPMLYKIDGATVPVFMGKDRLVGGFLPSAEMVESPPRTLEVWIKRDENRSRIQDIKQVALEWGQFQLTDRALDKVGVTADGKWHYVVLVFPKAQKPYPPRYTNFQQYASVRREGKDFPNRQRPGEPKNELTLAEEQIKAAAAIKYAPTQVYVDGKPAGELQTGPLMPADFERLHFGGHYDLIHWNWRYMFHGALSSVRVHKGALTPEQIQANANNKPQDIPNPTPELIFEVNAEALPEGKLETWAYAGSGGGTFVEGAPEKPVLPIVKEHNGQVGLWLGQIETLQSSFKTPESLDEGPFTIVARLARGVDSQPLPICRWGSKLFSNAGGFHHPWNHDPIFAWQEVWTNPNRKEAKPRLRHRGLSVPLQRKEKVLCRGREQRYSDEPTVLNPTAYLAWIWKTVAIAYDGETVRYYVDGKVELEVKAKLLKGQAKAMQGNHGWQEYFTLGGLRASESKPNNYPKAFLNRLEVYDRGFSVKAIEARTSVTPKRLPGKPIIDVDFSKIKPLTGVERIKNAGTLGGEFLCKEEHDKVTKPETIDRRPVVETMDGIRAVRFDGTNEFMRSETIAPDAVTDNDPFTFEAFIKPEAESDGGGLLQFGQRAGFFDSVDGIKVSTMLRAYREGKPNRRHLKNAAGWKHLVFVYEGRRKPSHVYIDGQQVSWSYFSAWYVPLMQKMTIGKGFGGDIARLRMWRGMKSEKEIAQMAKKALGQVKAK